MIFTHLRYFFLGMTPHEWWELRQHKLYWDAKYIGLMKSFGREGGMCLPELDYYLDIQSNLKLFADSQNQKVRMRKIWWDEEFEGWKNLKKKK